MQNTTNQAMDRFNDELEQIVNLKEMQKFQFANYFKKFDVIQKLKKDIKVKTNHQNKEVILNQIDDKAEVKREFDFREKLYYKPHFGPEETDSQIEAELERRILQKDYVKDNLSLQMDMKQNRKKSQFLKERADDLENIHIAKKIQQAEEEAIILKRIEEK